MSYSRAPSPHGPKTHYMQTTPIRLPPKVGPGPGRRPAPLPLSGVSRAPIHYGPKGRYLPSQTWHVPPKTGPGPGRQPAPPLALSGPHHGGHGGHGHGGGHHGGGGYSWGDGYPSVIINEGVDGPCTAPWLYPPGACAASMVMRPLSGNDCACHGGMGDFLDGADLTTYAVIGGIALLAYHAFFK